MSNDYYVKTNMPPEYLSAVMLAVFESWVKFALGLSELGGRKLVHPTGKYASLLQFRREGESRIAIIADEQAANGVARWIEEGHGRIDLKQKLQDGKIYKIHGTRNSAQQIAQTGLRRRRITTGVGTTETVWTEIRNREATGFAKMNIHGNADSWVIPPRVAYSPARILYNLLKSQT
jgi:hypothetical protein